MAEKAGKLVDVKVHRSMVLAKLPVIRAWLLLVNLAASQGGRVVLTGRQLHEIASEDGRIRLSRAAAAKAIPELSRLGMIDARQVGNGWDISIPMGTAGV